MTVAMLGMDKMTSRCHSLTECEILGPCSGPLSPYRSSHLLLVFKDEISA